MADVPATWHRLPVSKFPRDPMCKGGLPFNSDRAVAAVTEMSRPQPARLRLLHVQPEALQQWHSPCGSSTPPRAKLALALPQSTGHPHRGLSAVATGKSSGLRLRRPLLQQSVARDGRCFLGLADPLPLSDIAIVVSQRAKFQVLGAHTQTHVAFMPYTQTSRYRSVGQCPCHAVCGYRARATHQLPIAMRTLGCRPQPTAAKLRLTDWRWPGFVDLGPESCCGSVWVPLTAGPVCTRSTAEARPSMTHVAWRCVEQDATSLAGASQGTTPLDRLWLHGSPPTTVVPRPRLCPAARGHFAAAIVSDRQVL